MKKIVLFLIIPFILNACALCTLSVPKITAKVNFNIKNETITNLHVKWIFEEEFTLQMLPSYDENANDKLDNNEVREIEQVLISYIMSRNFLTELHSYSPTSSQNILLKAKNYKLIYNEKKLYFDFDIPLSIELKNKSTLKLIFVDNEGFFDFKMENFEQKKINENLFIKPNTNLNVIFFEITNKYTKVSATKKLSDITLNKTQEEQKVESSYIKLLKTSLKTYSDKIKNLLKDIKKENSVSSMLLLIFFSFLYGIFHALGPGHGKTLVGSYFVINGGGWRKALSMSIYIGIIHVAGAFILVITSMYILQTYINKTLADTSIYTSYISASIIIFISLMLLYRKIFANKDNIHTCSCCSCNQTQKKGLLVAVAAGIVPCPGTVIIFIMMFVLGSYLSGFLSAIAMALGMSSVIFTSSIFAQYLHSNISKNFHNIFFVVEYITIIVMLLLGITLIISPITI